MRFLILAGKVSRRGLGPVLATAIVALAVPVGAAAAAAVSTTFTFTGAEQSYRVPIGSRSSRFTRSGRRVGLVAGMTVLRAALGHP